MFLWLLCIVSVSASEIIVFSQKDFLKKVSSENKKLAFSCSVGNTKREGLLYSFLFLKYGDGNKCLPLCADIRVRNIEK